MSLFDAVLANDSRSLSAQLAAGADPNPFDDEGLTPLMVAAREGHSELVALLLEAGGDPILTNALGETALVLAATYGNTDSVRLLWDSGSQADQDMARAHLATGRTGTTAPTQPEGFRHKLASASAYVAGKLGDDGPTARLERALRSQKQRKP
ncbi:ankyrin repeat domain-containing protein [Myxococcus sp. AS-1-15]|jgi:ankyrin repeat protein|uniref:ankyrin repeat domain-containing protein n=1 Tax=Myxococcus sp. AS-1-15 TaxID=2874600 RepID=UPI001CBF256C|nr:ankyrin repeat domain-containing protein [Myxococcus sp. AS-1-15]MBZ4395309.1 ankyrin repeat domain-containing protein [Myxococcus sp. AS-1-15]BDT30663.1 ankyrin repeat domain-containing protein [Myxococcus sp. MH1]